MLMLTMITFPGTHTNSIWIEMMIVILLLMTIYQYPVMLVTLPTMWTMAILILSPQHHCHHNYEHHNRQGDKMMTPPQPSAPMLPHTLNLLFACLLLPIQTKLLLIQLCHFLLWTHLVKQYSDEKYWKANKYFVDFLNHLSEVDIIWSLAQGPDTKMPQWTNWSKFTWTSESSNLWSHCIELLYIRGHWTDKCSILHFDNLVWKLSPRLNFHSKVFK